MLAFKTNDVSELILVNLVVSQGELGHLENDVKRKSEVNFGFL